jgi:hypothetical protein
LTQKRVKKQKKKKEVGGNSWAQICLLNNVFKKKQLSTLLLNKIIDTKINLFHCQISIDDFLYFLLSQELDW